MSHPINVLSIAVFASLLLSSTSFAASGCADLNKTGPSGDYQSANQKRKNQGNQCGEKKILKTKFDKIQKAIDASCKKQGIDVSSQLQQVQKAMDKACEGYDKYLQNADKVCKDYGAGVDQAKATEASAKNAAFNNVQSADFNKVKDMHKEAAEQYRKLGDENATGFQSAKEALNRQDGRNGDQQTNQDVKTIKMMIDGKANALLAQANSKMGGAREKIASGDGMDLNAGTKILRFKTNQEVAQFHQDMDNCKQAAQDLEALNKDIYQEKVAKKIGEMQQESTTLHKEFQTQRLNHDTAADQAAASAAKLAPGDAGSPTAQKPAAQTAPDGGLDSQNPNHAQEAKAQEQRQADKEIRQGQYFTNSTSATPYTQQERLDKLYQPNYDTVTTSDGIYRVYTSKGDGSKIRIKQ